MRGGAGSGRRHRAGKQAPSLVDGLARSATGRTGATKCHNFQFNFFFQFFFLVCILFQSLTSKRASTVFRRYYTSVGRLGLVPATPRRITENRRPTRRGDHRERGRSVGPGPLFRWRCPRRCVVNVNQTFPLSPQSTILFSFQHHPHSGAPLPFFFVPLLPSPSPFPPSFLLSVRLGFGLAD